MKLEKYQYNPSTSAWLWQLATQADVEEIVNLTEQYFQSEIMAGFEPDRQHYTYNVSQGILTQTFNAGREQLALARDKIHRRVIAYSWIGAGTGVLYSQNTTAEGKMVHIDKTLSVRDRITLTVQILQNWIQWSQVCGYDVLVSTSVRDEQATFMRIHDLLGFQLKGSIAYRRLR